MCRDVSAGVVLDYLTTDVSTSRGGFICSIKNKTNRNRASSSSSRVCDRSKRIHRTKHETKRSRFKIIISIRKSGTNRPYRSACTCIARVCTRNYARGKHCLDVLGIPTFDRPSLFFYPLEFFPRSDVSCSKRNISFSFRPSRRSVTIWSGDAKSSGRTVFWKTSPLVVCYSPSSDSFNVYERTLSTDTDAEQILRVWLNVREPVKSQRPVKCVGVSSCRVHV